MKTTKLLEQKIQELECENSRLRQQLEIYQERAIAESLHNTTLKDEAVSRAASARRKKAGKALESALKDGENLYRKAIEVGDAVPYYQNYQTNTYDFVGSGIQKILGYAPDEFTPELWEQITLEIIPGGDLQNYPLEEAIQKARERKGVSWRADCRVRTRSGKECWLANSAVQVFDNQGQVIGSLGILQDITNRKNTEAALQESQSFYASLVENIPQCIFRKDREGRFTYIDPSFSKLLGKSNDEVMGKTDFDFYPPDLAEKYRKDDQAILASKQSLETIEENQTPDGQRIYVQVVKTPLFDAKGKVVGLQGIFWDITESKRVEAVLREREERLRSIFRAAPIGIGLVYNRILKEVNDQFCEIVGYSREELIHQNTRLLYSTKEEYDRVGNTIYRQMNEHGIGAMEVQWQKKDGTRRDVHLSLTSLDPNNPASEILFTATDITYRKQMENTLRENERMLSTLMSNLPGMVYRCSNDPDWTMTFVSEGAFNLTGYEPSDLIANRKASYGDLIHPTDQNRVWTQVQEALENHKTFQLVYRIRAKSGAEKWVWERGRGVYAADESLLCLEGFITDITENKRVEEALQESERQFRSLVEQINYIVWRITLDGTLTYISPAVKRITGYEPNELLGLSLNVILTPDSLQKAVASLEKRKRGEYGREGVLLVLKHMRKDGSLFIGETQSTPIYNSSGELIEIQGITRDITDYQREEEEKNLRTARIEKQKSVIIELMSSETVWSGDVVSALRYITELTAECVEVERTGVWLLNLNWDELNCRDLFERTTRQHSDGYVLTKEEFSPEIEYLKEEGYIDADHAQTDPRTEIYNEKYLEPLGITSRLDTPIRSSGKVMGFLSLEHRGTPRSWQEDEISFAVAIADQIAQVLVNSERIQAEEALRESEERLTGIVETSPVGIYMVNREGCIIFVNSTAEKILGLNRNEILFHKPNDPEWNWKITTLDGDPLPDGALPSQQILQTGISVSGLELAILRSDGVKIYISINASPVRDHTDTIIGVIVVLTDITEHKQIEAEKTKLEERCHQAQKMEAVGQLAGGVAHDFNNLLTAISGYTNMALAKLEPERQVVRSHLEQVLQAADRAAMLTRQLLAFSRREVMHCKNLDLNELITNLIRMLRRIIGEHIELHTLTEKELHTIYADPSQIEQILMNLCVNARDAMPNGGEIWIETQNVYLDQKYVEANSWAKAGKYVRLSVSDSGSGMPPEILEHVFEPFFTTKEVGKGTGLGLATVYGIVKQHNGLIHVYSEPNQGAVFRIYLPSVEIEKIQEPVIPESGKIIGGTETILIAEDEELVREMVKTLLEQTGYRVLLAKDGEDAIQIFQKYADGVDLALLDVIMPKASGKVVAERIQATHPQIPILFSSGYDYPVLSMNNTLNEPVDLIQKPYNPRELLKRVRDKLDDAKKKNSEITNS